MVWQVAPNQVIICWQGKFPDRFADDKNVGKFWRVMVVLLGLIESSHHLTLIYTGNALNYEAILA